MGSVIEGNHYSDTIQATQSSCTYILIDQYYLSYLVVSLCSTPIASMTVVVYSMPVVREIPRL